MIPLILGSVLNAAASGSIARLNSRGLKGHPCRVPLCTEKYSEMVLLVQTEDRGAEYRVLIHEIKLETKPKFFQNGEQILPIHAVKSLLGIQ